MGPSDRWGYWVRVAQIWSSQPQGLTLQATDSLNSQSRACQNCALARCCSTIYGMFLIHYEDLMCSSWFLLWLRCTFSLLPNLGRCLGRGIVPYSLFWLLRQFVLAGFTDKSAQLPSQLLICLQVFISVGQTVFLNYTPGSMWS
jgi:hypothetical protein